jgi:hypothetical protein
VKEANKVKELHKNNPYIIAIDDNGFLFIDSGLEPRRFKIINGQAVNVNGNAPGHGQFEWRTGL